MAAAPEDADECERERVDRARERSERREEKRKDRELKRAIRDFIQGR